MRGWWFVPCLVPLAGCGLFGDPGELVGEMTVTTTLEENSCGGALGSIPSTSQLEVQLFERSGQLTWSAAQGTFQAEIDEEGNFVFQAYGSQLLRAEVPDGLGGVLAACVVESAEEIRGTLVRRVAPTTEDGGDVDDEATEETVPARVTATDTLQVGVVPGADCRDFIGLGSARFPTLPCRMVLRLEGSEE
ncbi:MAG: hypothetical protein JXB32_24060 [Deltaproteobacteria bacterium]|nr:hypothetical protein [Deltaproteobacteria bacterium]